MNARLTKTLVHLFPIVMAAVLLLGSPKPVQAAGCFTNLGHCFYRAAVVDSFWWRWAAGLDCELGFLGCVREIVSW
jgi:hypothetical protein